MSNRKINYNRKVPSSESIKNRQNFDEIISNVTVAPKPFFKSIGFWGAIGSSVIALTLLTYEYLSTTKKNNAYDATSTLAIQPNQLPEDTKCITPISESVDHDFESYSIDPTIENTLFFEGGAIVSIPANAFELKNEGDVSINARVFRNKSEAFVAGIPMDYGTQSALESAGMIELRGLQNGEVVNLKPAKSIVVTLGLHKDPNGFDFFSLNETNGDWVKHQADVSNSSNDIQSSSIDLLKAELDRNVKAEKTLFNEIENAKFPTKTEFNLIENKDQVFELKFNKQEFPELKAFDRLQFEAKCNQSKYSNILQKTWSDVALKQGLHGEYQAEFSNQRGDKTAIEVVPVLTGKQAQEAYENYERAVKRVKANTVKKQQELDELKAKNEIRKKRIQKLVNDQDKQAAERIENDELRASKVMQEQTKMLNDLYQASATFKTKRWGVFNSDKPVKYPKAPSQPYAFASNDRIVTPNRVYVFDIDKDVRYEYGSSNHPLEQVAFENNTTVIVVRDLNGKMGFARLGNKKDANNGHIQLTPINSNEADLEFFKTLLNEKDRVRA